MEIFQLLTSSRNNRLISLLAKGHNSSARKLRDSYFRVIATLKLKLCVTFLRVCFCKELPTTDD
jgi:hypothetical protein